MRNHRLERIPDLSHRATLSELMDEPCSYEDLRGCLHDLSQVNRVTFAYRPTLQWLDQMIRVPHPDRPVHIVDVGCGGGDMLRRIERWASRNQVQLCLTGIDLNPLAIRIAREFTPKESKIQWIVGDAYTSDTAIEPIDLVISSLFTHHLVDDEIIKFLGWMEHVTRRGWFISDLHRSTASYVGFRVLATAAHWHHFIQYDGPTSIRRAFRSSDWQRYIEASGLRQHSIHVESHWPGRLCVSRSKLQ